MSNNNNNNRSRSSSLPPLRQIPVRASALPSTSSPIMEQAGEININGRISALEDLINVLINALPTQGTVTTSATSSSNTPFPEPAAETASPTIASIIDKREVNKRHFTTTSTSVMAVFKDNKMFHFHYSTKINVYHSRSYFSLSLMPYQIS